MSPDPGGRSTMTRAFGNNDMWISAAATKKELRNAAWKEKKLRENDEKQKPPTKNMKR